MKYINTIHTFPHASTSCLCFVRSYINSILHVVSFFFLYYACLIVVTVRWHSLTNSFLSPSETVSPSHVNGADDALAISLPAQPWANVELHRLNMMEDRMYAFYHYIITIILVLSYQRIFIVRI